MSSSEDDRMEIYIKIPFTAFMLMEKYGGMRIIMRKYKKAGVFLLLLMLCFTMTACTGRMAEAEKSSLNYSSETGQTGDTGVENSLKNGAASGESQENAMDEHGSSRQNDTDLNGKGKQQDTDTEKIRITENEPVRIAVIDTGFSTRAINAEYITEGKNYLNSEGSTEDTYGHGTAVASVILQFVSDVQLIPLVSSAYEDGHMKQVDGDTLAQILRDAVDVYGCQIINVSAGLGKDEDALRNAVEYVQSRGTLVIASAGNDYKENGAVKYYPAAYSSVLAVGALNSAGTAIADFSQRGDWVNVYAPGEEISFLTLSGAQKTGEGTSYAAARVSGEAAKLWKEHPDMTEAQVRETLIQSDNDKK